MADITSRFYLRHLRGSSTSWVRHNAHGKVRHEGVGQSFWYRPLTAVLSEVPVDDRELPLLFHARTSDYADVTVQATVSYRIADPHRAATRLDFSIDGQHGAWRAQPLDQIATLLAALAQQPALDLLTRMPLTEALTGGASPVREAGAAALGEDPRLAETGVAVVSARVVAIRPEPDMERALQTPTREGLQQEADRATYERRAVAVERERAIAENELQSKIELARRQNQLVEQDGANARRTAELDAAAQLVTAQGQAEREQVSAASAAESARVTTAARAEGTKAMRLAEAEGEVARMAAYRDLPDAVLQMLALRELAGKLPQIGQLTVTPDILTGLLTRFGAAHDGATGGGAHATPARDGSN
jgi:regulator of protease activity HflC (stomatin/prohibitin superfamily)